MPILIKYFYSPLWILGALKVLEPFVLTSFISYVLLHVYDNLGWFNEFKKNIGTEFITN